VLAILIIGPRGGQPLPEGPSVDYPQMPCATSPPRPSLFTKTTGRVPLLIRSAKRIIGFVLTADVILNFRRLVQPRIASLSVPIV
jgi:hypothetical protein